MTATQLTAREAAARVGISVKTLDRYQRAGLIRPDYTPGGHRRFTEDAVDALVRARAADPAEPTD